MKLSQEGKEREGLHIENVMGRRLAVLSTFEQVEPSDVFFFSIWSISKTSANKDQMHASLKVGPKVLPVPVSPTPVWDGDADSLEANHVDE